LTHNRFRMCVRVNLLVTEHDGNGIILTTRRKKKRAKCKMAGCDHPAHSLWMMALGGHCQLRCLRCETRGPVVDEGPWAAQQALFMFTAG
jgi:hypothetical protein